MWLRMQELQVRLDAATDSGDRLRRELDRRLEITEEQAVEPPSFMPTQ
jgi:hypothetical protein